MSVLSFKSKSEVVEEDKQNRIFFHDLINHTHGILLFLNQKINHGKSADLAELELLKQELKLMQSLVQDHFKFQHKNLVNTKELVSFDIFENSLDLMFKIYFPENINIKKEFRGQIAVFEKSNIRESAIVHFPSLYRIMNNLIKNMAEAKSLELSFMFDYNPKGLIVETRNTFKSQFTEGDIADQLSRVILSEKKNSYSGLGLDSIHELVKKENGEFHFDIEKNTWVNKVFIPHRIEMKSTIKKSAA